MVYITGHTFTNRMTNVITARVYANCDSVELFLNGASQGSRVNPDHIFTWPLTLRAETNEVQAVGTAGGVQVRDSLVWVAPAPPAVSAPTAASSAAAGDSLTISGR
jgi:hypothetical protein